MELSFENQLSSPVSIASHPLYPSTVWKLGRTIDAYRQVTSGSELAKGVKEMSAILQEGNEQTLQTALQTDHTTSTEGYNHLLGFFNNSFATFRGYQNFMTKEGVVVLSWLNESEDVRGDGKHFEDMELFFECFPQLLSTYFTRVDGKHRIPGMLRATKGKDESICVFTIEPDIKDESSWRLRADGIEQKYGKGKDSLYNQIHFSISARI